MGISKNRAFREGNFFCYVPSCLVLILTLTLACGKDDLSPSRKLLGKKFEIRENPEQRPPELPAFMSYPGAKIVADGKYLSGRHFKAPQGVVVMNTRDAISTIRKYYETGMERGGWNLIQSRIGDREILLMAESGDAIRYRKLITVIIRSSNHGNFRKSRKSIKSRNPKNATTGTSATKKTGAIIKIYYRRTEG